MSNITSDTYYWVKRTEVLFLKKESQQLQTYTFESNRNIDLVEGEWELVRVKESPNEKRKKKIQCKTQRRRWNEGKAMPSGTQASLTGCLAPSLSVAVASVWWMCSHPVRGGCREKCCLSERTAWLQGGGWGWGWNRASTGRRGPCETLWSTLNWSLWGQGARHTAGLSFEIFLLSWLQIIWMRGPELIQNYLFCWLVFEIIHVCRNSGWEILVSAPSIRRMVIFDKLKD